MAVRLDPFTTITNVHWRDQTTTEPTTSSTSEEPHGTWYYFQFARCEGGGDDPDNPRVTGWYELNELDTDSPAPQLHHIILGSLGSWSAWYPFQTAGFDELVYYVMDDTTLMPDGVPVTGEFCPSYLTEQPPGSGNFAPRPEDPSTYEFSQGWCKIWISDDWPLPAFQPEGHHGFRQDGDARIVTPPTVDTSDEEGHPDP